MSYRASTCALVYVPKTACKLMPDDPSRSRADSPSPLCHFLSPRRQRVPKDGADAQSSSSPSNATATAPKRDFSLKEGETISVRLGSQAATKKTTKSSDNSGGGAIPLLAPPPGVTRKR